MISLRFARPRKFTGALSVAIIGSVLAPIFAAPEAPPKGIPIRAARRAVSKKAEVENAVPQPASSGALREFADAFPTNIPAAPDLELRADGARKADAIVAFADALISEDNADTEKSLEGYRKVLELDPGYAELAVKVAYELSRRNDVSAGIQVLKDCIKVAPKEPMPLIFLSQLYAKQLKKPDLALKAAEQALAVAPDNFACYLAIYELSIAAGDSKKAEAVLEKAVKTGSTDAKFWIQIGDLYTRLFLKEDGSCQPDQQRKMNEVYRRAAELAAGDVITLARVGDYFILSQQVKEAIPYYEKVVASPVPDKDPLLTSTRDKLARAFIVTQRRDEAIAVLERMAKDDPSRFATFEMLGELYRQKDDFEKALHNFEHSLQLENSDPQNYVRLSLMLMEAKRPGRAVEIMQQARGKFPDVPRITMILAISLSKAKRHAEAMTAFAQAVTEAENSHEELLNDTFYFQYGAAAEQAGLTEKAVELLKQCIELNPNSAAEAYNYIGYMWADRGEHLDEAGDMIKKALEMDPDNASYLDSLGWFLFKKGEHEQALKQLLRAAESIKQEDAVVFDHLADTYQAIGRTAEAMNYWQKAVALSADDKAQADKIAEKLEAAKQKVTSKGPAKPEPAPVPAN